MKSHRTWRAINRFWTAECIIATKLVIKIGKTVWHELKVGSSGERDKFGEWKTYFCVINLAISIIFICLPLYADKIYTMRLERIFVSVHLCNRFYPCTCNRFAAGIFPIVLLFLLCREIVLPALIINNWHFGFSISIANNEKILQSHPRGDYVFYAIYFVGQLADISDVWHYARIVSLREWQMCLTTIPSACLLHRTTTYSQQPSKLVA